MSRAGLLRLYRWLALAFACSGDMYAERELAGRFRAGVRRARVLAALERHPRRHRHEALVRALERGRFSREQWTRAQKLAGEVAAPERSS